MISSDRVAVPLLTQVIPDGVEPGTIITVEYDADSQWFAVATTITTRHVSAGHMSAYYAMARPREKIRKDLAKLGLDVSACEEKGLLYVNDLYSATLGMQSESLEKLEPSLLAVHPESGEKPSYGVLQSLKVADLSVAWLKTIREKASDSTDLRELRRGSLAIWESTSSLLRFNEEKAVLEWIETRRNLSQRMNKGVVLDGVVRGIHSESFYKRLEAASDGVIDVRVMEEEKEPKNFLRVRSLKGQPHDARWHEIAVKPNGEAVVTT